MSKPDFFSLKKRWLYGMLAAIILASFLRCGTSDKDHDTSKIKNASDPTARVIGPNLIAIKEGSLLEKKLEITEVKLDRVTTPILTVTGAVMARLRPGNEPIVNRWQFSSVELSAMFSDWQKARAEMDFATKALQKTKELTTAQMTSQQKVVDRLRKLVATGTEAVRDLTTAEANLLENQLQGQKDVFEAESALMQATHSHADLERRLLGSGVDPVLLSRANPGDAMVMAEVPEVRVSLVAVGQASSATFYGLPHQRFSGVIRSLSPALSTERRTLRIFFEIQDAKNQLKPGMYAEIGLGTEPRDSILASVDGVLHIGDTDYVLKGGERGQWEAKIVQVGERAGEGVEILSGLSKGERLIGHGAILLKPLVTQAILLARKAPIIEGDDP